MALVFRYGFSYHDIVGLSAPKSQAVRKNLKKRPKTQSEWKMSSPAKNRLPNPAADWLDQSQLAEILGVTPRTAGVMAKEGKLTVYEHGIRCAGRRKYSRTLLERDIQQHHAAALSRLGDGLADAAARN